MKLHVYRLFKRAIRAAAYSAIGALVVLVTVFVLYLNNQEDLQPWHLADLDEEFTRHSEIKTFKQYLALEERLFAQLEREVYEKTGPARNQQLNRYHHGSLSDPRHWSPNWNRSFELPANTPAAAVLLLHGASDSPYSVHHLGMGLHRAGAYVIGLRLPGHGTAPSGLLNVDWQDMAAAVRLAMRHLAEQSDGSPLYIVGYSTGAALALNYAMARLEDDSLPEVKRLVLLSPAIGLTRVAALAKWQARLGRLLGLEKLAWNAVLPEYDPFKYGSFAVNAGNLVYELANEVQRQLNALAQAQKLDEVPPVLAFSSVVDATVSASRLVSDLFDRLPDNGHELVLFDINRMEQIEPILRWSPSEVIGGLSARPNMRFGLTLVTNVNATSREVVARSFVPGQAEPAESAAGLYTWPDDVYSLAHVALPFPVKDALYGDHPASVSPSGLRLGSIALRGERGVLQVSASDMLRLRWNPFYPYIENRMLGFFGLANP